MKRVIREIDELNDSFRIYRINVDVIFEPEVAVESGEILPIGGEGNKLDPEALTRYDEFVLNALAVFDAHDFEIIENHGSPYTHSEYFSLVKKSDLENYNYKYILFIRISDHDIWDRSKDLQKKYYSNLAETLKQPPTKASQVWKFKNIVVNKEHFDTYEEALDAIDQRLPD